MNFDQLSNAGKIWLIVFCHQQSSGVYQTWGQMARTVRACGVPNQESHAGRNELHLFFKASMEASAKARAERQRQQKRFQK